MNPRRKGTLIAALAVLAACSNPPVPPSGPTPNPGQTSLGTHTVSWSVGEECSALPPAARQRTYDAILQGDLVTLTSGQFLQGSICTDTTNMGCNQFLVSQNGDAASIDIQSFDWHGGQIVERIEDGTWLEVSAIGTGRVEGSTIRGSLEGGVWYCAIASSNPFPCASFRGCRTKDLQITIARKVP
jgi:hypothetical protein